MDVLGAGKQFPMAVEGQASDAGGGGGGGISWDGMGRVCDVHVPADLAFRVSAHPDLSEEFRRKIVECFPVFPAPLISQPGESVPALHLAAAGFGWLRVGGRNEAGTMPAKRRPDNLRLQQKWIF